MRRRNGCVGTLIVLVVLLGLLVNTATAKLWTLQNGTDTIKIEDTIGIDSQTALPQSLGMSYWTMTGTTADRLVQQWFWYRVGPMGPQHSLSELPMTPSKTYVSTPITTPPNVAFTYTDSAGEFKVTVDYTLTGGTTTNKTANVLKRVTIQNLTANPLEYHLYHYSDYDVRSVAAKGTTPKTDFDLAAVRGNRAYQTSFTGTALSHTFDGITVVQSATRQPDKSEVGLGGGWDTLSVIEDPSILDPFEMGDFKGPVLDFNDDVAYDDTNNMLFGMQWDLSVPANGSITFDVVDTVYPSRPLVTSPSYTGTCASNGQQITYNICYNNSLNTALALTNGRIDYYLDRTSYVSSSTGGVYDATANKVSWVVPTIAANAPQTCVTVTGKSDNKYDARHRTEVWSDQTYPQVLAQAIPLCNHPPDIYSNPPLLASETTLTAGVLWTWDVNAVDGDANAITYSIDSGPVGMTINSSTGLISWTPSVGQAGTYRITVRVSDSLSFSTQSFSLTVVTTNHPPVFTSTPVTTAREGELYTYQAKATDSDGDVLSYSIAAGPTGLTINGSTGLISYTPAYGTAGTYTVVVGVVDSNPDGRVFQTYTLNIAIGAVPNTAPKITSAPVLNGMENQAYTYQVVASDPDANDTIGYSLVAGPTGMYINNTTGLISWLPNYSQAGTYTVTVQVTDAAAASATQTYSLAIGNVNRNPSFTSTPITAGTVNAPYSYLASATDPDGDAIVAYKLTTFPAGMGINTVTGQINWTPPAVGVNNVTVTATDSLGGVGSQTFQINVVQSGGSNQPPVITSTPPTAAVPEGGTYMYRITATDPNNDAITYSLGAGAPAGLILDPTAGLLMWLPDYRNIGVWSVTVNVRDSFNNTTPHTFTITVANTLPHFTSDPTRSLDPNKPPATQGTDGGPYYYTATATDDGGAPVTLTLGSGPAGMVINSQGIVAWPNPIAGTYTIKVNATDGIATVTQTYTLTVTHVNRSPVITSLPSSTTINEGSVFSYTVKATDPDGDAVTYSLVTAPTGMTINATTGAVTWTTKAANVGTVNVTVGASDGKLSVDQAITLTVKELPPVFTSSPTTTGSVSAPYTYTALATDPGGVAVTYSFSAAPAGMTINATSGAVNWTSPTAGSYPVSIVATDGKMTASQNFTLVIAGINYPPVISSTAPTAAVNEGSVYTYDVNATDSNNDALTYTLGAGAPATMSINTSTGLITWTPMAANIGTTSVTVNVADGNGGSVNQTFSITVNNVAPVFTSTPITTWTAGVAYAYNAVASDPGGAAVTYTLTAAPTGMTVNSSTGVVSWASPVAGTYTITLSASDTRSTVTQTGTLTVNPPGTNGPPVITTTAPTTGKEAVLYTYDVNASDPNGDVITYSLVTGSPAGMTIVASTGVISWTPDYTQAGTFTVKVRATDTGNLFAEQTFTVTVANTDRAPVFTSTPVNSGMEDFPYSYQVAASDPDGDVITYSLTSAPAGMTISATGLISWTPTHAQIGNNLVTVSAKGATLATPQSFSIQVGTYAHTPKIESTAVTAGTVSLPYGYQVVATDLDAGSVLSYTLQGTATNPIPTGMSINALTGLISWTPTATGSYPITVVATDNTGLSGSQSFTIVVGTGGNVAPVINSAAVTTGVVGQPYSYQVVATDGNGNLLTYSLTTKPAGMVISSTGLISWTPSTVGTNSVTVSVSDGTAAATQTYTLTVAAPPNNPPTITSSAVTTGTATQAYTYQIIASDPEGSALIYSLPTKPAGMTISSSGLISWTPTAAGTYNVVASVSDGSATVSQSFSIVVAAPPNVPPVISSPAVTTATVGQAYTYQVVATDADGNPLTFSLTASPAGMTISATGLVSWTPSAVGSSSVTVSVSDGITSTTQSYSLITVLPPNANPTITSTAPTAAVNEGGTYTYDVNATDTDGDTLTYSLATGAPTTMTINATTGVISWAPLAANIGSNSVTVNVADGKGGTATQTFSITVNNVAPVFTSTPVTTGTSGLAYSYTAVATDAGKATVTYTLATGFPTGMTISAAGVVSWASPVTGTYSITVNANDGRVTTPQTFTLTITAANAAPVITSTAPTAAVNEGSVYTYDVNATDANNDTLTYSLATGAPAGMTINASTGVITWTPLAANVGAVSVTVNVSDSKVVTPQTFTVNVANVAPVFTSTPVTSWTAGLAYSYTAIATDAGGAAIAYSLATGAPTGMAVSATGVVSWAAPVAGTYSITVNANDGRATTPQTFTLTVTAANAAPVITSTAPTTAVNEGSVYSYDVNATDANNDTLTYSVATGAPAGMTINASTGVITWTPMAASVGTVSVTVNVSDTKVVTPQTFTINVANVAPVFTSSPVTTGTAGTAYNYAAIATDAGGAAITYALATGAPAGMTISATGVVNWTTPVAGTYSITVNAGDGKATTPQTYTLTIGTAVPPTITSTAPTAAVNEGSAFTYDVNATDPNNAVLTYSLATGAPAGMTINATTGVISWTPLAAGVGNASVTVNVSNGSATANQTFSITVNNVAPVFTSTPITTGVAGTAYTYTAAATDAGGATISYSLATGSPTGMTISAAGVVSWASPVAGTYTITVNASDGKATTPQAYTLIIAVPANRAPSITSTAVTTATENAAYAYTVTATDPDAGDAVTFSLQAAPAGMTINATTGLVSWTPDFTQSGNQAVTVVATDKAGLFATQSFTIVVANTNRLPVITSTAPTTGTVGKLYTYQVVANDPDGSALTYTLTTRPSGMTISSTGLISWTPTSTQTGARSVSVRVSDGTGNTTQSFSVNVVTNQAPTISSTAVTTATVSTPYSYQVVAADANGDTLTYSLTTRPTGMTISSTGLITWTPTATGNNAVTVSVSDGSLSRTQSYTLVVSAAANTPPAITSTAPTAAVNEGSTYTYDVNATDANGDTLTYSLATGAPAGMTINASTGVISWTPMAAAVGTATATVTVADGKGGSINQTFTVTINNVAPVFTSTPVTAATTGSAYSYTATATDAGGAAITYSLATGAPTGMTISTAGVVNWASPVAGTYSITINANDGRVATAQTFTLTVTATNRAPSITSTPVTTATENAAYTYTVIATDPDAGDAVTFSLTASPAGMTINATSGVISWTPDYTQSGSQSVTARATDKGGLFADQSFTITVANVDRAPAITSTAVTTATQGVAYSYLVAASDPDGDAITYALTTAPAGMTINASTGLINWTPSATGSFNVTVTATAGTLSAPQTFTVTVAPPANRAPSITSTAVTAATENAVYTYAVTATDPDAGDVVTFSLPVFPVGMTINATTGVINWTPSYTQSGSQNVTVRATDKSGLFAEQTFVITVANVDRAPGITSVPVTAATQNVAYSYQVVASDPDGDAITYSLATGAPAGMTISTAGLISWTPSAAGTFNVSAIATAAGATATQPFTVTVSAATVDNPPVITSAAPTAAVVGVPFSYQVVATDPEGKPLSYSLTTTQTGMTINATTGLIGWTPSSTQTGARSVTVRVTDGTLAATQSFTVNVTANQSPVITSTAKTTATVNRAYTYQVVANDPEGRTLTYSLTTRPTGMTINASTGLISWTPTVTGSNSVTVSVTDGVSTARTQSYTVTVVTNTAPTFTSTAVTSAVVNRPYSYQVTATDTNGDAITFSLTTRPTGMTINATTGLISWTPTSTGSNSVTVSASDGSASRTQSYTLSVVNNSAPVISSTAVTSGVVNTAYTYDVNATDANNDTLTYSLTTAPAGMTIDPATGLISWTPTAAGSNNVTVSVTDATATTNQSFTINVTLVANQAPVITSTAPTSATAGKLYTYQVAASDPEGTPLTYSLPTTQTGMTISSTGLISWTPTSTQTGARTVVVRVSDGSLTADQSFTITVAANTTPTITSTAVTTATVNRQYSYQLVATDPDGNTLTYSLTTRPSGMTINASTGLITWTPTATGSNSVTVSVSDGLASRTQSFTVSVISNQAPVISSSAPTLALVGQQYTYQVVATDANKDTLTYSLPTTQTGMTISSTGLITWTPTSTQTGSRSVSVRVSDGSLNTTQNFTITVRTTNAAPVITTTSLSSATAGSAYSRTLTATDSNNDTLRWSLTTAPTGMTISTSGTISWTPTTAQRGTQTVTVAVTDTLAITTKTFTLTVN